MLRPDRSIECVYLHCMPVDMRKQMDGLALLAKDVIREDPMSGMALWMICLGGRLLVPLINLLNELMLAESVIHCDETRLQVLRSDKAPTADHWIWVRAAGPPGRRIVLFDYDASRGGAVPRRLLDGFSGVLVTDGYTAYDGAAAALKLTHAGCMTHVRRYFEEACEVGTDASTATAALDFIGRLSLIERGLWDREWPATPAERVTVRQQQSAPIMAAFSAWLAARAPRVLPESRLGKAVHYALGQWPKLGVFLTHGDVPPLPTDAGRLRTRAALTT